MERDFAAANLALARAEGATLEDQERFLDQARFHRKEYMKSVMKEEALGGHQLTAKETIDKIMGEHGYSSKNRDMAIDMYNTYMKRGQDPPFEIGAFPGSVYGEPCPGSTYGPQPKGTPRVGCPTGRNMTTTKETQKSNILANRRWHQVRCDVCRPLFDEARTHNEAQKEAEQISANKGKAAAAASRPPRGASPENGDVAVQATGTESAGRLIAAASLMSGLALDGKAK